MSITVARSTKSSAADASIAASDHAAFTWRPLKILVLYRLVITGFLVLIGLPAQISELVKAADPQTFLTAAVAYLAAAIILAAMSNKRRPAFETQVYLQAATDISAIGAMMYAVGSTGGMLGILMTVAVTGSALLIGRKMSILFASVATLTLLGINAMFWLTAHDFSFSIASFAQAGVLGIVLFLAALTANSLAKTARENAALATQRGIALADLEQLNEYVVQHLQTGIMAIDHNGNIRMMNESARLMLGLPRHVAPPNLIDASPELARQLNEWRNDIRFAPNIFAPALEAPAVMPRFSPFGGSGSGGTVVILDDTAILAGKIQQVKLASLGRLTASIAHEIRNPLGAISHAAQLLDESPKLEGIDKRMVQIINDQSRRVNTIIENILQLSRREESQPRSIPIRLWLTEFTEDFCRNSGVPAELVNIAFDDDVNEIWMDPNHLQQVLWNLCQNALKYGRSANQDQAKIDIKAGFDVTLRAPYLEVRDYGPGVSKEIASHIFEPFVTSDSKGTGLGLYICRELCECNQARLQYLAPSGPGACFRINFVDTQRQVL